MGLDMYLTKRNDIRQGDFYKPEHRQEVIVKTGGEIDTTIDPKKVSVVIEDVGYWRKANHIHNWFVKNVQDDKDDCREYRVSEDELKSLHDTCKKVLENRELAEELLPTQGGFFFGNTDYDEWYFQDVEDTVKIIDDILAKDPELTADYYYQSSW